ncbi:MAG: hypothetical protein KDD69_15340 [Bdellovibrionales bacterium]|nr:hypothetical protein [Bdellovibrionales bacterium]
MNASALLSDSSPGAADLSRRAKERLEQRLATDHRFTVEELQRVSKLDFRLFPRDFALDEEATRQLRALCRLSQCELKDPREITSHRPVIGRGIVAVKRVIWRIMSAFLRDSFAGVQEMNSWMVYSQAKLFVRVHTAERELARLQANR